MGNANGTANDRRSAAAGDPYGRSNGGFQNHATNARVPSADLMVNSPPLSPRHSASPLSFAPQIPAVPLQRSNDPFPNQVWPNESQVSADQSPEQCIPTLISWSYGGNNVAVEGSWDNWRLRKALQRSGKDHTVLLVLPSGIYHYRFIVDGEVKYRPDLPCLADEMGFDCNILEVHDYVPENLASVSEFEAPPSPVSSYSQDFPEEGDLNKDPAVVPPQLHLSVLGTENREDASSPPPPRPQHVVLDHLFIEQGWASDSVVALGLTHRFRSKYVTVVLYKPLQR